MTAIIELNDLTGTWTGTNKLWMSPDEPVAVSESVAQIQPIAQSQFTEIRYSWSLDENEQEGRLILGSPTGDHIVKAVWFDTWHMMNQFMNCEGSVGDDRMVRITGSYSAPPGPDWGWQITIEPIHHSSFHFSMHNITPKGDAFLAVEAIYTRQI